MLGVGSGDAIDSAQFTYTVSRVESSDAVNASVPVGCIRCIQLVATSDPVDTRKPTIASSMGKAKSPATPNTLDIPISLSLDKTCSITVVDDRFESCNMVLLDTASLVGADTCD